MRVSTGLRRAALQTRELRLLLTGIVDQPPRRGSVFRATFVVSSPRYSRTTAPLICFGLTGGGDGGGLRALVKSLQPAIIINDRLPGQGDYKTPEQGFPVVTPTGPWELCLTIGQMWAWHPGDTKSKSTRSLVTTLIEVASRGGNLLLNIGPKGDGSLNESQVKTLTEIGDWMAKHAESVIGVSPTVGVDYYGPSTARPGVMYLHLVMQPVERGIVRGIPVGRVTGIRLLATGEQLPYEVNYEVHEQLAPGADPLGELLIAAPRASGAAVDVIALEFA